VIIDLAEFLIDLIQFWGPPGLIIAMVIQAILAPIPSELILSFAGAAFINQYGFWPGITITLLSALCGSLLGAVIAFFIGKKGGYALLSRFVDEKELEIASDHIEQWGIWAILITRLIPFIPFDAVSYGAGVVNMDFSTFIIPTFIGLIPRIVFYSIIGSEINILLTRDFELAMLILALTVSVLVGLYYFIFRKIMKTGSTSILDENHENVG